MAVDLLKKEVVQITNTKGLSLYGILTRPCPENNRKCLVISCQSGVVAKGEIGDHLRWVADRLGEQGVAVLRFDQHGTGDSQGEGERDIPVRLFFQKVQDGCFVNDTLSAIDWAVESFGDYEIFLLGECGGCISALAAGAERLKKIQGYILIAAPVLRFPDKSSNAPQIGAFDAKITIKQYCQKIFNPESWLRFISGKSDFKLFFYSILNQLAVFGRKKYLKIFTCTRQEPEHSDFNMLFWESFKVITEAQKHICFLLPELDNETFEFNVEFEQKILDKHKKYSNCEVVSLPHTDHSIMFQQSRKLLVSSIFNWLTKVESSHV